MSNELRLPRGLTVERIDAFIHALHKELNAQAAALDKVPVGERDLDRAALQMLFEQHGFGAAWHYLGVDLAAPVTEFVSDLRNAEDEQLDAWCRLVSAYPGGRVSLDDLELV